MTQASGSAVVRIEMWHGIMLLALLGFLVPGGILEPKALLLGGLFMGVNFFLLSYGVRWLFAALAKKRKMGLGIFLLLLKFVLFLGLILALFTKVDIDAPSFALGITCLLIAIVVDTLWSFRKTGE